MVGGSLSLSPRESLSSIKRVQTVVTILDDSSLSERSPCRGQQQQQPVTANFNKLQHELELLQAKLNDVSSHGRPGQAFFRNI